MTTIHRVFNFAAGPAVLPLPVLEEIQTVTRTWGEQVTP